MAGGEDHFNFGQTPRFTKPQNSHNVFQIHIFAQYIGPSYVWLCLVNQGTSAVFAQLPFVRQWGVGSHKHKLTTCVSAVFAGKPATCSLIPARFHPSSSRACFSCQPLPRGSPCLLRWCWCFFGVNDSTHLSAISAGRSCAEKMQRETENGDLLGEDSHAEILRQKFTLLKVRLMSY